jgi:hypothetical protein
MLFIEFFLVKSLVIEFRRFLKLQPMSLTRSPNMRTGPCYQPNSPHKLTLRKIGDTSSTVSFLERCALCVSRMRRNHRNLFGFGNIVPLTLLNSEGLANDWTVACCCLQGRDSIATARGRGGRGEHPQRGRATAF